MKFQRDKDEIEGIRPSSSLSNSSLFLVYFCIWIGLIKYRVFLVFFPYTTIIHTISITHIFLRLIRFVLVTNIPCRPSMIVGKLTPSLPLTSLNGLRFRFQWSTFLSWFRPTDRLPLWCFVSTHGGLWGGLLLCLPFFMEGKEDERFKEGMEGDRLGSVFGRLNPWTFYGGWP